MSDRPRDWNGQVIWLLERVAGLGSGYGPGTPSGSVPIGIGVNDVVHYVNGTHGAIGSGGVITLQLPETERTWLLAAFSYNRLAGSGNKITPRVGQVSGFADGGPDERVALAQQNANVKVNAVFQYPVPFWVDADYRAYFRPNFNSGSDNTGRYQFWFIQGRTTEESPS